MNKTEKAAILKIAKFHLSELSKLVSNKEPEQYKTRQAHRDILQGFKFYGFIQDFNIDKGVLINTVWHRNNY
jgi:hypothetical protein